MRRVEQPIEEPPAVEPVSSEHLAEINATEEVLDREAGHAGESAKVVVGALGRVRENGISLGDLLESCFGLGLLAAVRVVLEGEAPKGVLDRLVVCVARDAEDFVVVALTDGRHHRRSSIGSWSDLLVLRLHHRMALRCDTLHRVDSFCQEVSSVAG
jgi:hypothetical protein